MNEAVGSVLYPTWRQKNERLKTMKNDRFAEIAAGYQPASDRGLLPILPPELPQKRIPLDTDPDINWRLPEKIDTREKLENALKKLRCKYVKDGMNNTVYTAIPTSARCMRSSVIY